MLTFHSTWTHQAAVLCLWHVAHHLLSAMPDYHARDATAVLQGVGFREP